jgi:hypothetical protein
LYGAIEAPFAQPRAIFFGHTISALIAVGITKLFLHLPAESFEDHLWLAGSLSCAIASTVMAMTKTIHPPAGGTALIAATQADIRALGWYYVPVVMLSAVLMMAVGLITNNIQRRYPMYWWTCTPLRHHEPVEAAQNSIETPSNSGLSLVRSGISPASFTDVEKVTESIIVSAENVVVPEFLMLSYDQQSVLEELQIKIKEYYGVADEY